MRWLCLIYWRKAAHVITGLAARQSCFRPVGSVQRGLDLAVPDPCHQVFGRRHTEVKHPAAPDHSWGSAHDAHLGCISGCASRRSCDFRFWKKLCLTVGYMEKWLRERDCGRTIFCGCRSVCKGFLNFCACDRMRSLVRPVLAADLYPWPGR